VEFSDIINNLSAFCWILHIDVKKCTVKHALSCQTVSTQINIVTVISNIKLIYKMITSVNQMPKRTSIKNQADCDATSSVTLVCFQSVMSLKMCLHCNDFFAHKM
jgi:hypothetical protein